MRGVLAGRVGEGERMSDKLYRQSANELMADAAKMWEREARRMMHIAQKESGLVARTLREIAVGLQNKARWAREYAGEEN